VPIFTQISHKYNPKFWEKFKNFTKKAKAAVYFINQYELRSFKTAFLLHWGFNDKNNEFGDALMPNKSAKGARQNYLCTLCNLYILTF
jgi:hypothetical protein